MISFNEEEQITVKYQCPKCKKQVINTLNYLPATLRKKDAEKLAKKQICKKCKIKK